MLSSLSNQVEEERLLVNDKGKLFLIHIIGVREARKTAAKASCEEKAYRHGLKMLWQIIHHLKRR